MKCNPLVSVIMPVYNAQETVHVALESLLQQTYTELEIILINDSSKDDTLGILQDFIPLLKRKVMLVKLLTHEKNQGVAAARNTGLDNASGEYIYYLDADDRIELNAIKLMVVEALSKNADIVGSNWFLSFDKNERRMNQASFTTPWEGIERILNGSMRWNLWLFMVRRSLYEVHQVRFMPGMNMGEDLMVMIKLFSHASRVSYIDQALYYYGQSNEESLTKTYSNDHIKQVTTNVQEVEDYLLMSKFASKVDEHLFFLKLNIKLPLLISDKPENYKRWLTWFPECNDKVMTNQAMATRTRLLQWCAVKHQFWIIKLYYLVVIRFIYGTIYK